MQSLSSKVEQFLGSVASVTELQECEAQLTDAILLLFAPASGAERCGWSEADEQTWRDLTVLDKLRREVVTEIASIRAKAGLEILGAESMTLPS